VTVNDPRAKADTFAAVDAEALEQHATAEIAAAATLDELDAARVKYLGRKSELKQALREVRDRDTGMALNALRGRLEAAVQTKRDELERAELERVYAQSAVDVTLPGEPVGRGRLHLLTQIRREIEDIFLGMGYEVYEGPEVVDAWHNFDALTTDRGHPSRSPNDTLYLSDDVLLRTHTSPDQILLMESRRPPIYAIMPGRVYRRDTPDATHSPTFLQVEALVVDRNITLADLKGTVLHFFRQLFGPMREVRMRTSFFPFTEPSVEFDVTCFICDAKGCPVCKHSGWIEMGGAGWVDPQVFVNVGYDPDEWTGFAFGLGIERIAMLRHGLPDLRLFWENDVRVLEQF
jgi:phenylalanyl-tRNA synthetase alpha chain